MACFWPFLRDRRLVAKAQSDSEGGRPGYTGKNHLQPCKGDIASILPLQGLLIYPAGLLAARNHTVREVRHAPGGAASGPVEPHRPSGAPDGPTHGG